MRHDDLTAGAEAVPVGFDEVAQARDAAQERLMGTDNVVGVGLGYKISNGVQTDTKSVMVLVTEKLPSSMLGTTQALPKTVSKVPTDVVDVGHVFAGGATALETLDAQSLAKRVRPVRPGYSVGHFKITAGTIGAGCYDISPVPGKPPRYYILSNNHVLANSNQANIGDPIYQPGPVDGGTAADAVGRLSRFVPIKFDGSCNAVDAAIAEVSFDTLDRDIYWTGYPTSAVRVAEVGQLLKKTGRTTHFTTGRVTAVNATINVNYGGGNVAKFCNQIVTTDMSAGGDSGSLVLDLENNPVGLLFAGSSTATILNPIANVQLALKVRVWP